MNKYRQGKETRTRQTHISQHQHHGYGKRNMKQIPNVLSKIFKANILPVSPKTQGTKKPTYYTSSKKRSNQKRNKKTVSEVMGLLPEAGP